MNGNQLLEAQLQLAKQVRTHLYPFFSDDRDNPEDYWVSGFVESIERKGEELEFRLPFVRLNGIITKPFSLYQRASSQGRTTTPFNVRIWNLIKSGLVHKNGDVYREITSALFPKKTFTLQPPFNESFVSLNNLECLPSLRKIILPKNYSHPIKFCVFNNIKSGNTIYDQVIIPCAEIARFYFFNSSNLITALLTPSNLDTEENVIYNPTSSGDWYDDKGEKMLTIVLREGLIEDDGPIVARIAFSPTAKRAISFIHRSLLYPESQKYIQCPLPTDDSTRLECHTIEIDQDGKKYLLITEIINCTDSFPFETLHVGIERTEKKDTPPDKPNSNDENPPGKPPKPPSKEPSPPPKVVPDQPGHKYNRDAMVFVFASRFKDLESKKIIPIVENTKASRNLDGKKEPIVKSLSKDPDPNEPPRAPKPKKYTVGAARGNNPGVTAVGAGIKEKQFPKIPPDDTDQVKELDTKLKASRFKLIYDLRQQYDLLGYQTTFRKLFTITEDSDFTYMVYDAESAPSIWAFTDYEKGIRRRALLLEVTFDNKSFVIIDHQVKKKDDSALKYVALENFKSPSRDDLRDICNTMVKNQGKIARIIQGKLDSILGERFIVARNYHSDRPADKLASQIIDLIIKSKEESERKLKEKKDRGPIEL